MNHHKWLVDKCLITILFFFSASVGYAQDSLHQTPAGTIGNVSGTLISINQDKTKHKLSNGDTFYFSTTLITSKDSFAELNFNNGSSWTMKPGTKIKIIVESKRNQTYFKVKLGVGGLLIRSQNMRNSSDIYFISTALGTVKILPAQSEPALLIYETGFGLIFSGMAELERNDKYQIKLKKPVTIILSPYSIKYYDKIFQPSIFEKSSPEQLKNDLNNMKTIEVIFPNSLKSNKFD